MARTRRKDRLDVEGKRPDYHFGAPFEPERSPSAPTQAELDKAHRDGKPGYKPSRAAKVALHKGRKARLKQAVIRAVDPEEIVLPRERRSDVWDFN